jgi:DNA damage-inducible protein 1
MLYVNVKVNGHPIKAFVDSGAQSTIMSPSCAEACNIHHLIDDRYAGIARGVGTAKILGRVHSAKIEIGDAELDCSFTVMEGKDVDLLFGLDMLRRHQACIDLKENELRFPHTKVSFLPESEIPKRWGEQLADEPVVQGPNGTEIGTKTGTVRPAGSSAQAAEHLHNGEKGKETDEQAASAQSASSQAAGAASTSTPAQQGNSTQPSSNAASASTGQVRAAYPEKDIATLTSMGFSREEAIGALDASGGNVEYAIGFLVG